MNKKLRVLIILANFLVSLILVPVSIIGGFVYTTYVKFKYDCGLTYKDAYGALFEGFKESFDNNIRFLKTGDLNEFRN